MIRIAICDREETRAQEIFDRGREVLRTIKTKCELSLHKDFAKVRANLAADKNYYDIYILSGRDGEALALAKQLRGVNLVASIIFTDQDYTRLHDLLKFRPTALVLEKDIAARLGDAMDTCRNEQLRNLHYFTVKNKDGLMRIDFNDITFVESRQRIAVMHTRKQTIEFYAKLSEVMEQLPGDEFVHCHQSYIVNMRKVSKLDKANRCFILGTGTPVEISKSNYAQVLTKYTEFISV